MRLSTEGAAADELARLRAAMSQTRDEVRTPLNLITSLSHLMLRGETDPAQLGRLHAVEQAVRHLGAIVDELLDLSRDDPTQSPPPARPLRLALLLEDVAVMLRPLAHPRGLSLAVEAPSWLPSGALRGDAAQLRQAMLHAGRWVLGMAEAGPVQMRLLRGPQVGERLTLRLELAFASQQPLAADSQGRAGPDPAGPPGSERAALQRLALRQGGQCGLEGVAPGHWCCWFTAQVRVEPAPAAAGGAAVHGAIGDKPSATVAERLRLRHAGRRVLVVEDDKVNQIVMLELLGDVGLLADTADDGQEALERVVGQPYALVAMDLRMPRLDGLGATRALRQMPALDRTPIIAVTANAFDEDRAACKAAGMNDFIPKPIDVDRLYAVLLHWLDRSPVDLPAAAVAPLAPLAPAAPAMPPTPAPATHGPGTVPAGIDPALVPLLGLEGIDALGGLGAVGGRVATYRRLLGVFIDAHQGDGQAVGQLLHDDEAEAAGRLAHRLRGSAATLGLVDVETAAAGLEAAIDRGERGPGLSPLSDAVQRALVITVPALRTALAG